MNKWKQIFCENDFTIDEKKKMKTIEKLKAEIVNTEIPVKESYFNKIKIYIPFTNKLTFVFQFILLLIGILAIKSMTFEKTRLILSLVMPILAFLQIMELERSFKYNMYEIEMSCKINLKELISIKLLISTFINLCIMTIFALMTGIRFNYESYLLIVYFLVPFLITNVANIALMRLLKNKSSELINLATMFIINALLLIFNMRFPCVYELSSVLVWIGILIITILYLIKAAYQFYEEEEDYIWNLQ